MKKKIFVVTGEYSGEIHASNVVKMLKQISDDYIIEGIGGDNLKAQGVKLFEHIKNLSAVGLSPQIIWHHYVLGKKLVKYLKEEFKPDLVLLVDYGGFNLGIAKYLKEAGIKIFYYIPPQLWASRQYRIKRVKKYIDKVLCIFPFEEPLYKSYGIDVHYCGHPLGYSLSAPAYKKGFFEKYNLDMNKKLVSVFPGSRVFELKYLMKIFKKSVEILQKKHPDLQFCISQAPNISDTIYDKYFGDSDLKVIKGDNQALLSVSDALILASGTVALEACLYHTPMVIAYNAPKFFYWIYLLVRCIDKVSLPNIIANKFIIPELIVKDAKPELIVKNIENILYDSTKRLIMVSELSNVAKLLSDKNSALEAAKVIDKELFP
ncbi:lipid-A-disaccharide synthase [bacterium]|nr:lipid-A-disaccharide synthase [bacterium]MBP3847820.1 lipid-A-disaccharide synthase [bacterium]